MYHIRDWDKHFENAGSRKIESTKWVPMPNKRGFGYTKLEKQPNGEAMFGCWCALVELASTCEVRGDLRSGSHWFSVEDFADLIGFSHKTISDTLAFCSKSLDWIVDMTATTSLPLDYQPSTTLLDENTPIPVLCNSIPCPSIPCPESEQEGKAAKIAEQHHPCSVLLKLRVLQKKQMKITDKILSGWDNEVRLMIERDDRTEEQITTLINECHDMRPRNGLTWDDHIR